MNGIVRVYNLRHYNVVIVFLLEIGSFTNLVICIYVHRKKLAHTLEIDCILTFNINNHFCFCFKESQKINACLGVWFLLDHPVVNRQVYIIHFNHMITKIIINGPVQIRWPAAG